MYIVHCSCFMPMMKNIPKCVDAMISSPPHDFPPITPNCAAPKVPLQNMTKEIACYPQ